jgi:hypothetical protein
MQGQPWEKVQDSLWKIKEKERPGGVSQVVECLLSKHARPWVQTPAELKTKKIYLIYPNDRNAKKLYIQIIYIYVCYIIYKPFITNVL